MGDQVTGEQLTEVVTELADSHAELVAAVRGLLAGAVPTSEKSTCQHAHLCEPQLAALRRLTGDT